MSLSGNSQVTGSVFQGNVLLPISKNLKWGLIDKTGKIIIEPNFDGISDFNSQGLAYIYLDDKKGILNNKGKVIIDPDFTDIQTVDSLYFAVFDGKYWGTYHKNGNKVADNLYPELKYLGNNFFAFAYDSAFGLLNRNGQIIMDTLYDDYKLTGFPEYLLTVKNKHYGLVDTTGNILVECIYHKFYLINRHFAAYSIDSFHWGGINLHDHTIVTDEWTGVKNCYPFIGFKKNEKWSLYSPDEHKFVIEARDNEIFSLDSNYSIVVQKAKMGIVDIKSNIIIPVVYDTIVYLPKKGFIVDSLNLFGLYGLNGKMVIPPSLTDIVPGISNPDFFTGYKNNSCGLFRYNGQILYPLKADEILIFQDRAKIYRNSDLTILKFDSIGQISDSLTFTNVHRIMVVRPARQSDFTPSALRVSSNYGWFESENSRWGLKDTNNKIVIKPSFYDINVQNDQFTIVRNPIPGKKPEFILGGLKISNTYYYGIVDHKNYKIIARPKFLDIRNDFVNGYNVTRVITSSNNHFGLLFINGAVKTKEISFVGEFYDSMAKINYKGVLIDNNIASKNNTLESINLQLNNLRFDFDIRNRYRTASTYVYVKGGNWGFIDQDGKQAIPAIYSNVKDFKYGKVMVSKNGKWGVIDKKNNTKIEFNYDRIERLDNSGDSFFKLIINVNKKGIINADGIISVPPKFDEIGNFSENRMKVKIGNSWGFADVSGKIIIKPIYREVHDFHEGRAAVKLGRRWGYIDTLGVYVISPCYRNCRDFHEGKACVYINGKYGFINLQGDTVIKPVLNNASDFSQGHCQAKKRKKTGMINASGNWVIFPKYTDVKPFDEYGLAIVEKGSKYGLIDNKGKKIVACRFTEIGTFSEGMTYVRKRNKYGFIDIKGKIIIPIKFDGARSFSNGMAAVKGKTLWGYIDKKGSQIIEPIFNRVSDFHNNRAVIGTRHKFGIIDKNGVVILKPNNYFAGDFNEGRAFIKKNQNSGFFIDTNGYKAFSLVVQDALPFNNGRALVKVNFLWGMIDLYGNYVVYPKYTMMKQISDTTFSFAFNEYSGISDLNGNIILEPVYEVIKYQGNHIFRVELDNKTGYINIMKNWIWKPTK